MRLRNIRCYQLLILGSEFIYYNADHCERNIILYNKDNSCISSWLYCSHLYLLFQNPQIHFTLTSRKIFLPNMAIIF